MRLNKITLNGQEYPVSAVTVIIGANNSGKTTLLNDLFEELTHVYERDSSQDFVGRSTSDTYWRNMVTQDAFTFETNEVKDWLKDHRIWRRSQMPQVDMFRSSTHMLQWQSGDEGALTQEELNSLNAQVGAGVVSRAEWLVKFKLSHVGIVRIDDRFTTANNISSIDAQSLDNPYLLYYREEEIESFNSHLEPLFQKTLIPLKTSMNQFSLMVAEAGLPSPIKWATSNKLDDELLTVAEHQDYFAENPNSRIEKQSHGTRAAMSLLMALIDKKRKILFLDEPESHIYPSARKYLANLIANSSAEQQFFVVTHDTEFLEGLSASGKDFTIIKLNRQRESKVIQFDTQEKRRTASELKNTKAIRAGFYDSAIFVEGINDKYIYDSVVKKMSLMPIDAEYGFIDCDGVDKVASSVKFAKDIGTAVAVIVDFDAITSPKKNMSDGSKKIKLNLILESLGVDASMCKRVDSLRESLKGKVDNKKGLGNKNLSIAEKEMVESLIVDLKSVGVFVVPVGELYDWFLEAGKDASIAPEILKTRFESNPSKYAALTNFLKGVCGSVTTR